MHKLKEWLKLSAWCKEKYPCRPGTIQTTDTTIKCWNASQNTTQRNRESVRFYTRFITDLYMPIGANVGSGQYLIRANAKISLSWQASPIFWLSIALHYKLAWLNTPPLLPKYEADWRSWIDIAGIFQFLRLCHRLVGWIISKIKYYRTAVLNMYKHEVCLFCSFCLLWCQVDHDYALKAREKTINILPCTAVLNMYKYGVCLFCSFFLLWC